MNETNLEVTALEDENRNCMAKDTNWWGTLLKVKISFQVLLNRGEGDCYLIERLQPSQVDFPPWC